MKKIISMLIGVCLLIGCEDDSPKIPNDDSTESETIVETIEKIKKRIDPIFDSCNSIEEFVDNIEKSPNLVNFYNVSVSGDAVFVTTKEGFTLA